MGEQTVLLDKIHALSLEKAKVVTELAETQQALSGREAELEKCRRVSERRLLKMVKNKRKWNSREKQHTARIAELRLTEKFAHELEIEFGEIEQIAYALGMGENMPDGWELNHKLGRLMKTALKDTNDAEQN